MDCKDMSTKHSDDPTSTTTGSSSSSTSSTDKNREELSIQEQLNNAIAIADPYRGCGTSYLHTTIIPNNKNKNQDTNDSAITPTENIYDRYQSNPSGAIVVPISVATTFQQVIPGVPVNPNDPNSFGKGYEYSRTGNPTRGAFERAMAMAEHAQYAVAFASGSAATSAVIHSTVHYGDHIICVDDVYGGTQRYLRQIVTPMMGIQIDFCDMSNPKSLPWKKITTTTTGTNNGSSNGSTKLVWLETPTNPTMKITDIRAMSNEIRRHHQQQSPMHLDHHHMSHHHDDDCCVLAVDNTFCSPYFQSPLDLGADLVVHSVTKYIGGHSDVVMGVVCTNSQQLYDKLRFVQNGMGAVPSPFDCFLAHRGLKTLHLRMEASARNAYAIALFLESHTAVRRVSYPGLPSHPQHELAKRQQHGFGSMITFYAQGGRSESSIILQNLRVFALAESLGAVESLAECPSLMTHASVPDTERAKLGIDDSLIRLSIGVESCNDLIEDLRAALDLVKK